MIELELPYPPSVNHYWRHVGTRVLISRQGRVYREQVSAILAARRITPINGALTVHVKIFPPDRRRRDLDNTQKALLDALGNGGAYGDDSQIEKLVIEKLDVVPGGKATVRIEEIS